MARKAKDALREFREAHPEVQEEYDRLGPRFAAISALIDARQEAGLTQRELAERIGVSQAVIARFESGENSPRVDTLARVADALDYDVEVKFTPRQRRAS